MSVINEVKKRLEHNKLHEKFLAETLETLEQKIEIFDNEIAYVKDGGEFKPCIIVGVDLPNFKQVLEGYDDVHIRVMTKNGPKSILLKDLVPLNEKSKVLYGK